MFENFVQVSTNLYKFNRLLRPRETFAAIERGFVLDPFQLYEQTQRLNVCRHKTWNFSQRTLK